jgi:hypothetical protein
VRRGEGVTRERGKGGRCESNRGGNDEMRRRGVRKEGRDEGMRREEIRGEKTILAT